MNKLIKNTNPRIVMDRGLTELLSLYSALACRDDPEQKKPEKVIFIKTSLLCGQPALQLKSHDQKRIAWLVPMQGPPNSYLLWLGASTWEKCTLSEQGNLIPSRRNCESAVYVFDEDLINAAISYVHNGILPTTIHPRNHWKTLLG